MVPPIYTFLHISSMFQVMPETHYCRRNLEQWSLTQFQYFEIIISCLLGILKLNVKTSDAERPYTAALVRSGCNEGSSTFLLIPLQLPAPFVGDDMHSMLLLSFSTDSP